MPERDEELLEQIWMSEERGEKVKRSSLQEKGDEPLNAETLVQMEQEGLIRFDGDEVIFTQEGRRRAAGVIRRHRLAERLMTDVLDVTEQQVESTACQFEHLLSEEVTESICTLLGHPKKCPHGYPIPPGDCCRRNREEVRPVVVSLDKLRTGGEGTVAYVSTHYHHRLDKLASFGLLPGARIRLHQRQPSFVIEIGETTLAIDEETARDIYVRQSLA